MCSCHSILECCVTFSGVKLSIRSFVLFLFVLDIYICLVSAFYNLISDTLHLTGMLIPC